VGAKYAEKIASLSLEIYRAAQDYATERGIIIADTKFEFGLDESTSPPSVVLIDEVLTPDSSRFWDANSYEPGRPQASLDKQYLRDWLIQNGLKGKEASMPPDVVAKTRAGYIEAYERLSGTKWPSLRVLLVGSGGREHALAWKLSQSALVDRIFVCPGNGGTHGLPNTTNVSSISGSSFPDLVSFAQDNRINLLIPGPEQPLVDGIVDYFQAHAASINCFGPTRKAAHMEGSKVFSKDFMARWGIPTARYHCFSDYEAARQHVDSVAYDIVLKADGLAAGKGVIIPANKQEVHEALKSIMVDQAFGAAGLEVVIEEFLDGDEISILSFCDGSTIKSLPPAQDHKRIFDGDKGPNTGGMGTYAPAPSKIVSEATLREIEEKVLKPTMKGMKEEGKLSISFAAIPNVVKGFPFVGCLFSGYMITADGPRVLEYNVRFGDPETQSLLPLLESDLAEVMVACTEGRLAETDLRVSLKSAATVVIAAGGYPNSYKKGTPITLDAVPSGRHSPPRLL
jgi:phosphoribosylamine--glycine ligase/phosphoribosylformylglycinamidine cyclo-ligase